MGQMIGSLCIWVGDCGLHTFSRHLTKMPPSYLVGKMFQACGHSGHTEEIMGLVITEDKVFNTAALIYYKHYMCCELLRSGQKCNKKKLSYL